MQIALYARVSTVDKEQNPETQFRELREFVRKSGWDVYREYADQAPAGDMTRRVEWREMLDDAAKHKFDVLVVWKMDRAFRSVLDAANTLERLRGWKVGLRSYTEPWLDTTSPFGEALYYITVAYAQLERGIIRERVKSGMARAKAQGLHVGRRRVDVAEALKRVKPDVLQGFYAGTVSMRQLADKAGVARATLKKYLNGIPV